MPMISLQLPAIRIAVPYQFDIGLQPELNNRCLHCAHLQSNHLVQRRHVDQSIDEYAMYN